MKKNYRFRKIICIIITIIVLITCGLIFKKIKCNNNDNIPNNYIAIFHGGVGEATYETYIYKIQNGQANYGFEYINVTVITTSWGSSNYAYKITDRGKFDSINSAFVIAEKNGAYSYATVPDNNKKYTMEEFQSIFLAN